MDSFHCGSGCQNAEAYPAALAVAKSVFDLAAGKHGLRLTLLDIGGGFPGWDGSESMYRTPPPSGGAAGGEGGGGGKVSGVGGQPAHSGTAVTSSAPGATDRSDSAVATDVDTNSYGASCVAAEQADGGVGSGEEGFVAPPPRPSPLPLSLAEIAEVTLPVLDELFPPDSGVQVRRIDCQYLSTGLEYMP